MAILRTAALAPAECCTPVWCHSVHTCIVNMANNDTLCVVTGYLHPTLLDNVPILVGIQPAELRRRQAMLCLNCQALVPGHLLYHKLADPAKQPQQLRSWYPFVPAAKQYLKTIKDKTSMWHIGQIIFDVQNGTTVPPDCALSLLMLDLAHWDWLCQTSVDESRPPSNWRWVLLLIHAICIQRC